MALFLVSVVALIACTVPSVEGFVTPSLPKIGVEKVNSTPLFAQRRTVIAGNWKENPDVVQDAEELGLAVAKACESKAADTDVVVIPPGGSYDL